MSLAEANVVGWVEESPGEPPFELSQAQWEALLAERQRVGRPLTDDEIRAVLLDVPEGLPVALAAEVNFGEMSEQELEALHEGSVEGGDDLDH